MCRPPQPLLCSLISLPHLPIDLPEPLPCSIAKKEWRETLMLYAKDEGRKPLNQTLSSLFFGFLALP
jgi:hypothetical protein